jgi:two-component sensor histidine kinase
MERFLQWLPERGQTRLIRYGSTTLIVALCFLLLKFVEGESGVSSFFIMFPAIFLAALLFDRGSGFIATGLSTALLVVSIQHQGGNQLLAQYWLPLSLFLLLGLGLATLTELLRKGWERAVEAEGVKDVLYRELGHRTKNDLALAASVLNLQARSQSHPQVKEALNTAVARLQVLGKAHERLDPTGKGEGVPMRDYIEAVCQSLKDSVSDSLRIDIRVECDELELPVQRAIPVGLIVNELMTNAYKHAFVADGKGHLSVSLRRGQRCVLAVEDDGMGCPDAAVPRVGSQLVQLLVRQLDGKMERRAAHPGCRVSIEFPETD